MKIMSLPKSKSKTKTKTPIARSADAPRRGRPPSGRERQWLRTEAEAFAWFERVGWLNNCRHPGITIELLHKNGQAFAGFMAGLK